MSEIKSDKLVEELRDAAKEVYEELGGGFKESVYRDAMAAELEAKRDIPCIRERSVDIYYKDTTVGLGRIDLLVGEEERIIVELKRKKRLSNLDKNQIRVYLDSARHDQI